MTSSHFLLSLVAAGLCLQNVAGRPWSALDKSSSSRTFSQLAKISESGQGRAARSGLSAKQETEVCESLRTVLSVCYDDTADRLLTNVACKALMNAASSQAKETEVDCDLSIPKPRSPAFSGRRLCSAIQTVLFHAQCQEWQQVKYSSRCVKLRRTAKFFTRHLKLKSCDIDDKPTTTLPSSPAPPATTTKQATVSTSTATTTAATLPTTTATTVAASPESATTTTTPPTTTTPTAPSETTTATTHTASSETTTATTTALPETTATITQDTTTESLPAMTSLTTMTTTTTAMPSDTTTAVTAQVNECLAIGGACFTASRCEGDSVAVEFAPCPGTGTICCLS